MEVNGSLDPAVAREVLDLTRLLAAVPRTIDRAAFADILQERDLFGIDRSPALSAWARMLASRTDRNVPPWGRSRSGAEALLDRLHLLHRTAPGILTLVAETRWRRDPLPRVSVIVVGGGERRARCIGSIRVLTGYPSYEVLACGATPEAVNGAAYLGRGPVLALVRGDAEIRGAAWLYDLVETLEAHPRIGAAGAAGAWDIGDADVDLAYTDVLFPGLAVPVSWLSAACLAIRREAFLEAGGLRGDLYGASPWCDADLGYALRAAGWVSVVAATPVSVVLPATAAPTADDPVARATFRRRWGGRCELVNAALGTETLIGTWDAAAGRWRPREAVIAA